MDSYLYSIPFKMLAEAQEIATKLEIVLETGNEREKRDFISLHYSDDECIFELFTEEHRANKARFWDDIFPEHAKDSLLWKCEKIEIPPSVINASFGISESDPAIGAHQSSENGRAETTKLLDHLFNGPLNTNFCPAYYPFGMDRNKCVSETILPPNETRK